MSFANYFFHIIVVEEGKLLFEGSDLMVKIIKLVMIDLILLHVITLVTAPIFTIVILGCGAMFTFKQIEEIKADKKAKEEQKENK